MGSPPPPERVDFTPNSDPFAALSQPNDRVVDLFSSQTRFACSAPLGH